MKIYSKDTSYKLAPAGLLLYAWVVMSNHVHLIISSKEGIKQEHIIRDFKKYTSKQLLKLIEENNQESRRNCLPARSRLAKAGILWIFKKAGERNSNNKNYQFWRQDNHPIELSTNEMKEQRLDYIHNNPVEEGIVDEPEHYVYSSARDYSGLKGMLDLEYIG